MVRKSRMRREKEVEESEEDEDDEEEEKEEEREKEEEARDNNKNYYCKENTIIQVNYKELRNAKDKKENKNTAKG